MNKTVPATLLCDFYKVSHRPQYPEGTEYVYSTWTPRSNAYFPEAKGAVAFGPQGLVKKYLIDYFNEHFFNRPKSEVVSEYQRFIYYTLIDPFERSKEPRVLESVDATHIAALHDLGYLPVRIKALKEGTLAPIKVPMLTIENTDDRFFWITNYLETIISTQIWLPMTSATTALEYRRILNDMAIKTTGSTDGVEYQCHDFSMRGMSGLESAQLSGAAHLLTNLGTDSIPSISYLEQYYNANIEDELVATSIPATEHSVMSAYGETNELDLLRRLITEIYPEGIFSVVCDTWDFWQVVGEYLPLLKDEIMKRNGKTVIRPDSGDPADILCGLDIPHYKTHEEGINTTTDNFRAELDSMTPTALLMTDIDQVKDFIVGNNKYSVSLHLNKDDSNNLNISTVGGQTPLTLSDKGLIQCLWDIFGGTVTKEGYKMLDSHIGAIYGDSITLERAIDICERLEKKGFASLNVVLGVGSFTYQYRTRDSLGFAMKATHAVVKGEERMLFKDPKTGDGTKRSQRGRVVVLKSEDGTITYKDNLNIKEWQAFQDQDLLEDIFINGILLRDETLSDIRKLTLSNIK